MKLTITNKTLSKLSDSTLKNIHSSLVSIKEHNEKFIQDANSFGDVESDEVEQLIDTVETSLVDIREALRSKGYRVKRDNSIVKTSSQTKSSSVADIDPTQLKK